MKVAICASEVVPFAKTGGLADVSGALPLALENQGQEVIIVMPGYKEIQNLNTKIKKLKEDISYAVVGKNIKVYFIDNERYFHRQELYGDKHGDYKDNLRRFSYYCKKTLELFKEIGFSPEVIHVHDWQASLIPVYLKALYSNSRFFINTKTVLTIHNLGYQGLFPKEEFPALGLDWTYFDIDKLEFFGRINILKGGIVFSDLITTVSSAYSREIQTKELGFGLEGVLHSRRKELFGILNGLDYSIWNPEIDEIIASNYSRDNLKGKKKDKEALQKICNLPVKEEVPLIGVVSRLAEQKGCDILAEAIEDICKMDLQLVILGTGDIKYHKILEKTARKYPFNMALFLKFDDILAHKIYAGADAFLMPSKYEPCGLGQIISLKYGTIPLVHKTGGLADTVNENNGLLFDVYKKENLIKMIKQMITAFPDKNKWNRLIDNAMKCDFSWAVSAKEYIKLYEKAKNPSS